PDGPGDKALDARLADLSLATAAQRLGGSPGFSMQQRFDRAAAPSHPTVTAVEVNGDELVLEEDGASLRIPLRAEWTAVSEDLAASATVVDGGRLIADLVFTCTPHRIELVL